jgi:F-type H+-transporting ATPase subunit b
MKLFSMRGAVLGVGVLALLLLTARGVAQVSHESGNQATPQQGQTVEGELAQESREAAGEDKNEALKHSGSVRLLSKLTGLDVHKAYWLAVVLNFAIIAGLVFWFGRKSLPGLFQNRTASIQKAMAEARKASAEANRRLAEIESRLTKLDVEIGTMQAHAEKEVEAEERRIAVATKEEARKIVETAEQEIAAAAKLARRDLKSYAADLAVTLAGKQIKVDSATDQALVERFAQQLTGDSGRKDS